MNTNTEEASISLSLSRSLCMSWNIRRSLNNNKCIRAWKHITEAMLVKRAPSTTSPNELQAYEKQLLSSDVQNQFTLYLAVCPDSSVEKKTTAEGSYIDVLNGMKRVDGCSRAHFAQRRKGSIENGFLQNRDSSPVKSIHSLNESKLKQIIRKLLLDAWITGEKIVLRKNTFSTVVSYVCDAIKHPCYSPSLSPENQEWEHAYRSLSWWVLSRDEARNAHPKIFCSLPDHVWIISWTDQWWITDIVDMSNPLGLFNQQDYRANKT